MREGGGGHALALPGLCACARVRTSVRSGACNGALARGQVAYRDALGRMGYTVRAVRGDGNCLFRSVCHQVRAAARVAWTVIALDVCVGGWRVARVRVHICARDGVCAFVSRMCVCAVYVCACVAYV